MGTILGVALALIAGATAANAGWGVRTPLPVSATSTGNLTVSAAWVGAAPIWAAPVPGSFSSTATLRVTSGGAGNTLRWALKLSPGVPVDFAPHVTLDARVGTCPVDGLSTGTGTAVPSTGYFTTGGLLPGAIVDVCVRLGLASTAPNTLANRTVNPAIGVFAEQRGS